MYLYLRFWEQADCSDTLSDRMGFCDLLLFPGVFQECEQTVFGESGFSDKDIRYQKFLPETEKYMAAEKSLSYLYLPVMQTEDPHTEGQGKD